VTFVTSNVKMIAIYKDILNEYIRRIQKNLGVSHVTKHFLQKLNYKVIQALYILRRDIMLVTCVTTELSAVEY
jgi:hypothetical protein